MNNKGFTLVELLAALTIISILVIIAVPSYNKVSSDTKKTSLENKQKAITTAMLNYANKYYIDDIKKEDNNGGISCLNKGCCKSYSVKYIVTNGIYYTSEKIKDESGTEYKTEINPVTGEELTGYVAIYYDTNNFKLAATFASDLADLSEISSECAKEENRK